jgi:hypothetical protein
MYLTSKHERTKLSLVCFGRGGLTPEVGSLSVIAITLRYDFALSHNAFILSRIVIGSNSYRSEHNLLSL